MSTLATNRATLALLTLTGLGLAAGVWRAGAAVPTTLNDDKDTALARAADADPAALARAKLAERVDLKEGIPANTPLQEALDHMSKEYGIPITLDEEAFKEIEVQKPGECPVSLPRMKGVRLGSVLRALLRQVRGNQHTGAYLVRPDGLLVTTSYVVLTEALGPAAGGEESGDEVRVPVPALIERVTCVDVQKQPLRAALRKLAREGFNIVVDARAGALADAPVSATMDNVLVDDAVRVLAEQADLKVVTLNNVMFVTTPERAETLAAEQKKRRVRPDAAGPGVPPPPQ